MPNDNLLKQLEKQGYKVTEARKFVCRACQREQHTACRNANTADCGCNHPEHNKD